MPKDLLELMHSVMFPRRVAEQSPIWRPPVDVYRSRDGWLLKVDLAGVQPEDISIELTDRQLRISGMRRDWCLEEGCHCYRMEIAYSRFERIVELPEDLVHAIVDTEFRHGMLLIRVITRTEQ